MKKILSIHPDKSRGQNFLIDRSVLKKIIAAAALELSDMVVEIGAGTGVLTSELARRVKKVVAFEIDKKLAVILKENLAGFDNVEIRNEDALAAVAEFTAGRREAALSYKIVANLPYNITAAVLEKFLPAAHPPVLMVLTVQKEAAQRICAPAGEMSFLSVLAQYCGRPEIVASVSPAAFWPRPKVESAILKINLRSRPAGFDEKKFFQTVKKGFSRRRRMLKNNLRGLVTEERTIKILKDLKLSPSVRPEELTVENWMELTDLIQ